MNRIKELIAGIRYRRQLEKEQRKLREALMRVAAGSIEKADDDIGRRFWSIYR